VSVLPSHVSQVTSKAPAVTAYWYENGVAASEACTFFPKIDYTGICRRIPSRERVTRLGPHSVGLEDPPGVKGDGWPSGGPFPANSVLTARPISGKIANATNVETCTLPQSQHSLCVGILNDFLKRYRL
jgi:hypothetical protein